MVTRWGMSDKVGLIYVARGDDGFLGSEGMMPEMGREVSDDLALSLTRRQSGSSRSATPWRRIPWPASGIAS